MFELSENKCYISNNYILILKNVLFLNIVDELIIDFQTIK